MILVFASFIFGGQLPIMQSGLGFAAAIFVDAYLIRTVLVPAVMHVLGRANWWIPGWLDRILPRLRVEPAELPGASPLIAGVAGMLGLGVAASVSPALFMAGFSLPSKLLQRVFALIELMRGAGLVRRIATNINQAVAKLNATGQPTGDLPAYAAGSSRHADNIDAVADAVRQALR